MEIPSSPSASTPLLFLICLFPEHRVREMLTKLFPLTTAKQSTTAMR
jgi:hypothetical protein